MERLDSESRDRSDEPTAAPVVAPAGEEASLAQISRLTFDDRPQSGPIDWDKLRALHAKLPPAMIGGGAALIRELRDMGY